MPWESCWARRTAKPLALWTPPWRGWPTTRWSGRTAPGRSAWPHPCSRRGTRLWVWTIPWRSCWQARPPRNCAHLFATLIREAELLGVLARGALSPLGTALLEADMAGLTAVCRRLLPTATRTARIGADLTAVVTGTPSAPLAALLDSVADRETSGTASVWRFSAGSVRRALDAGHSPDGLTADLAAVASGPLPQPLSYLIADTARGHGRVRIAPAACVIHGEEPALLTELAAHRKLGKLGLRQLAPTVLVSRSPIDATLAALRAEGYAPVAETADGTVRIEKTRPQRAAAVPTPGGPARAPIAAAQSAMPRRLRQPSTRTLWPPGYSPPHRPPRNPTLSAAGSLSAPTPRKSSPGTRSDCPTPTSASSPMPSTPGQPSLSNTSPPPATAPYAPSVASNSTRPTWTPGATCGTTSASSPSPASTTSCPRRTRSPSTPTHRARYTLLHH